MNKALKTTIILELLAFISSTITHFTDITAGFLNLFAWVTFLFGTFTFGVFLSKYFQEDEK